MGPRASFRIHFGVGLVPCVPVPSPNCDDIATCAPEFHPPVIKPLAEALEDKKEEKVDKPEKDQKGKKGKRVSDEPEKKAGRNEKCAEDSRGGGKIKRRAGETT